MATRSTQVSGVARKSDKKKRKRPRDQKKANTKITILIQSGEKPNTPEGRKEAAGMAHGMDRSGRLGGHGEYKKKKQGGQGGADYYETPGISSPTKEPKRDDRLRGYRRRGQVKGKYG
jgi:hypothetical protein